MKTTRKYLLKDKVDISKYVENNFTQHQIKQIAIGLKNKVEVSIYANKEFKGSQMEQIRLGLENNLDVSVYAKPDLFWKEMRKKRKLLMNSTDNSLYNNLTIENLIKTEWFNQFYSDQKRQILLGIEENVDVLQYAKPDLHFREMEEIRFKLNKKKLDKDGDFKKQD